MAESKPMQENKTSYNIFPKSNTSRDELQSISLLHIKKNK